MTDGAVGNLAGPKVLLVDDEEGVRSYCRRVLETEGAHVVEAADGATALRLVQLGELAFDIVVTDLLMPGVTGREVNEVLSVFRPDLPVLGISADAGATADRRLPVLRKPFTPEELLEAVGRARQRSREIRSTAQEKRRRSSLLRAAAAAAQLEASHVRETVDLVQAAIELRRLNGKTSGYSSGEWERRG
jgi:CheY-like chemotaxis protein